MEKNRKNFIFNRSPYKIRSLKMYWRIQRQYIFNWEAKKLSSE